MVKLEGKLKILKNSHIRFEVSSCNSSFITFSCLGSSFVKTRFKSSNNSRLFYLKIINVINYNNIFLRLKFIKSH